MDDRQGRPGRAERPAIPSNMPSATVRGPNPKLVPLADLQAPKVEPSTLEQQEGLRPDDGGRAALRPRAPITMPPRERLRGHRPAPRLASPQPAAASRVADLRPDRSPLMPAQPARPLPTRLPAAAAATGMPVARASLSIAALPGLACHAAAARLRRLDRRSRPAGKRRRR